MSEASKPQTNSVEPTSDALEQGSNGAEPGSDTTASAPPNSTTAPVKAGSRNPFILLRVLRPRQWTKNFIAFAPVLFGGRLGDPHALLAASACVACLCLVSGSIYVLNDIKDKEADAKHPTKKLRPIASGKVTPGTATVVAICAMTIGLLVGFFVRPSLGLVLVAYILLQVLYNYKLKSQAILDVFSIASGFVLRAVAGGVAAHVTLSGWFLLCTSLGALFLGIEKRRQELKILGRDADAHRKSFEKYSMDLIDRMEAVVVPSLVTCYAIYTYFSPYGSWMMLTVPFVLYGILRYQLLSTTKSVTGSPEEVLLRDRPIQISIVLWVLTSIGVIYNYIPLAMKAIVQFTDSLSLFVQR